MSILTQPNLINANAVDTDFKAETIAARLLSQGVEIERVSFMRKGANKRNVSKDISSISLSGNVDLNSDIEIGTNRSSIYDTLPEGLFHSTTSSIKNKSKEQVLETIKKQREEEFYCRRFFQPFEEEIDRGRIVAQFKELNFDNKNSSVDYIDIFTSYWPIIKDVDKRRAAIFLEIVPLAALIRTSHIKIANAMSLVFEMPVKLLGNYNVHNIKSEVKAPLGSMKLGETFITRGNLNDRSEDITIHVGPMNVQQFKSFNHNGEDAKMLTCLIDMLLPANCKVSTKFKLDKTSTVFTLGKKDGSAESFLGINTILK